MHLRYNFRVYPTLSQRAALAEAFGCARVVYNDALALRMETRKAGLPYMPDGEVMKRVTSQAKQTPERHWLTKVSSVVLQQAVSDLNLAYKSWVQSLLGKRQGPPVGHPQFRSRKDNRQAVRFTQNSRFKVLANGRLRLPKVGDIVVRWSRELPVTPTAVTIIKEASGRYFASFLVKTDDDEALPDIPSETGIDLGLTHFAILSDGTKVASPRFLRRAQRRLRKAQQDLSRKQKGSANRKKAVLRVARIHAQVKDARRDFHHKLSTQIIRENQAVYVESLGVAGLSRTRVAKSVHDAGWASFTRMLEYKAARYGRTLVRVGRTFPSSQVCSACGFRDGPKPLNVRTWTCRRCDTTHDRDVNAARNIRAEGKRIVAAGRAETENACGAQVRPGPVPAQRCEAGTHPKLSIQAVWEQAGIPGL